MGPLIQREFVDKWPWTLSRSLKASFEFHLAVLAMDARRVMKVHRARRSCIVVASDGASEEASGASVAALFCSPEARWGWCGELSDVAMGSWAEVRNPILKVEFYAIVIGLLVSWDSVVGCDLIWFVDSTAALAAAIKGTSKDQDVVAMTQLLYFLLFAGDIRVYWEYVESDSNWSDGASRDLLADLWSRQHGFYLQAIREIRILGGPLLERLDCLAAMRIGSGASASLAHCARELRRQREWAVGHNRLDCDSSGGEHPQSFPSPRGFA